MSLRIANFQTAPPGMWKYLVPETNTWIPNKKVHFTNQFVAYHDLKKAVEAHYKANNLPVPVDFDFKIQDWCCRQIPGRYCKDEKGRRNTTETGFEFNFATVIQGTLTLADWKLSGSPIESDTVISDRSNVCLSGAKDGQGNPKPCPFHASPETGCSTCGKSVDKLRSVIEDIVGKRRLPTDLNLKSCMVCGCSLIAKTRIPTAILLRHMSDEQIKRLPDFCWMNQ